ncbi:MAG: chromate transporter [Rubritalea sp.]|jgi:chromate transporter|tara:strand:- start:1974 stop:3155 length:1182 start_codon:yes stop_codon:yes gene_type:complete
MNFLICFLESLKLGLTSFGGPVAHLAYFRNAYVERLKWLSEERFAELLAVCQFMPGPASSQLGAAIGYEKGGWLGGLGAWLGFTLPSAILMILFVSGMDFLDGWVGSGWIQGLKIVAIAVVANAVLGMQKSLCPNAKGLSIAVLVAAILIIFQVPLLQPLLILLGGMLGIVLFRKITPSDNQAKDKLNHPWVSLVVLGCFVAAVVIISSVRFTDNEATMLAGLTKTGSMVFGGGHVVLPLLEAETVGKGLMTQKGPMTQDEFLAGYGLAQAVPGPMFTFGTYIGSLVGVDGNPWLGGALGTIAIFLPGMILLTIGMPIWNTYKNITYVRAALKGASAAVVGLILAALVYMLRAGAISNVLEASVALALAIVIYKKWVPVWLVVLSGIGIGFAL